MHLLHCFELPKRDKLCCSSAEAVGDLLTTQGHKLLGKHFQLYANKTYPKNKETWINDVCK